MEKPVGCIQRRNALLVSAPMKSILLSCAAAFFLALSHNFPALNPAFVFAYPLLFSIFQDRGIARGLVSSTIAITTATVAVVANPFFLAQPLLFLLLVLFMVSVFVPEVLALYLLSAKWRFPLAAAYLFVLAWRLLFCLIPGIFPFWWSAPSQLTPLAGVLSQWMLPPLGEAVMICLAVGVSWGLWRRQWRSLLRQFLLVLLLSVGATLLSGDFLVANPDSQRSGASSITIGFSQLSYSSKDYGYAEEYSGFAGQIAAAYLESMQEIPECKLLVLPESTLIDYDPAHQETLSQIAQDRNCHILAGMLVAEEGQRYNCAVLFPPDQAESAVKYRKRNLVPFVEGGALESGTRSQTMLVDGLHLLPLICFDTMYPASYQSKEAVDLAVAISSDVFAEGTSLARCHQSYGVFYARTFRLPLAQVTQNGATFCIHSDGGLEEVAAPYQRVQGVLELQIGE